MKLEDEIKQYSFRSNFQKAIINLKYTHHWFCRAELEILKPYGIQPQHFNVLRIVRGASPEPISPGNILEVMIDRGRDLTRLVDKLVKMGYLSKCCCPTNRRRMDITITEEGLNVTSEISNKLESHFEEINALNEEEAAQLSDLLDKLRSKSKNI